MARGLSGVAADERRHPDRAGAGGDPGLLKARIEGPELLTGGTFGMEHSIIALVLCTMAGVILLRMAIRRGLLPQPMWAR